MRCARCDHDGPPGARFCPNCGAALAEGVRSDGERRHATVVFSDLSGYTALNERLDPEEVEEIMERVKREASAVVERHGGVVNQFVGDEVMALFGIPTARRDDPVRAVRAALELHRAVRGISAEIGARIGQEVTMHTGVNTGLVIVRSSDAREGRYMLTGDTVNTAARLLKLAREDEIVVGQDTWREIGGEFDGEAGQPTEVKGKEKPVLPWRIRGERAAAPAQVRPLLGRGAEIARFEAIAQACLAGGRGRLIALRGDPGIGKTRLGAEFCARAAARGFAIQRALVLDFSAERGRDAIRSLARSFAGDAPQAGLAPEREVFLSDLLDAPLRPELRALAAAMDEATRNRGTTEALLSVARAAAMRRAQFLLVEDVHWADAWTLERLAALAGLVAELPLLLAVTTRRENDPTARLAANGIADTLDLGPLGIEEARALAAQFPAVSAESARLYVERADGNPLFLEQLLLNAGEAVAHNLPGSIQALVLARMDRLPPGDRSALQAASVLGQRFSLDALRHLMNDERQDCRGLLAHFLVRPEGDGYLFWHALVRDGAYESLLKSRRRELHARAGEWLLAREPALAAEHFDRARDARAPGAYLAASEEESRRYRFEHALALAARGLELAAAPADRHALLAARARNLLEAGRAADSIAAWRDTLAAAPDDAARCRALIGIAAGMRLIDRAADGLAALDEAAPLAAAPGLELERSRLHHLRGNLYFGLGRIDECLGEHQEAFAQALASGSKEAEANALGGLGDAYYIRGRMRSAYEQFNRCVELARRHGYGRIAVANLHMVGWTAHALLRLRESLAVAAECLELARAVSHRRVELIARGLGAFVAGWLMGDVDAGQRHLDLALPVARELGSKRFEGQARVYLAQLALRRGERPRAYALASEGLAFCRAHGMEFFGPVALGLVARLTDDASERASCDAEAIARLERGAISHNHFEYLALAIDGALERAAWDEAEDRCARLEAFTATEPLPLTGFLIARGRALAAVGRGGPGAVPAAQLASLASNARDAGLDVYLPALEAARARVELS